MPGGNNTYDISTPEGKVRLLLNDVSEPWIFSDEEVEAFLALEGNVVKLAAAQAIDTNADNQALALKVLRDKEITTDGAKLADSLRARANALRTQARAEADAAQLEDDDGYFFIAGPATYCRPELTGGFWQ